MRTRALAALAILAIGTMTAADPVRSQTYDPSYPVCLHVFGPVGYYECRYSSLPQCAMSASGRAADCVVNPYVGKRLSGVTVTPSPALSPRPLSDGHPLTWLAYLSSMTLPPSSDTRRSMRPANSMLWVAISMATCVALTSCISARNT